MNYLKRDDVIKHVQSQPVGTIFITDKFVYRKTQELHYGRATLWVELPRPKSSKIALQVVDLAIVTTIIKHHENNNPWSFS